MNGRVAPLMDLYNFKGSKEECIILIGEFLLIHFLYLHVPVRCAIGLLDAIPAVTV